MKIRPIILLLFLFPLLYGCAPAPVKIDRFDPIVGSPLEKVTLEGADKFINYADNELAVTAALAGSGNIFVVSLLIDNKTGGDLNAADYSVRLVDGRDDKPLQLVSREVVIEYRKKLATGQEIKSGNAMLDTALNQLSALTRTTGSSELAQYIRSVDWAIDHYFAFRPVYSREAREGVLCYYADFILEYPLTLMVKVKEKQLALRFQPVER
jgi:hypothetical protein